jgi:hypothetical protein
MERDMYIELVYEGVFVRNFLSRKFPTPSKNLLKINIRAVGILCCA